jgi:hypothetical protein
MNNKLVGLIVGALITTGVSEASATLLTYDDLGVPGSYTPGTAVGFVEQGFVFGNTMAVIDISSTSPWAQEGAAVSGDYAALPVYNSESAAITKSGGGTFSFDDTYLKGWTTSTTGHILGYLNGTLVGDVSYGVSGSAWTDVSVHFSNVDQVMINGLNGFLLDNSTVNEVSAVPEPSTWAMMILGFAGVGFMAYRRKSKPSLMAA